MRCKLVKNDHQNTSKVLFSFVPNKQFGELINISPHSLTMMNTVNTEFCYVEVLNLVSTETRFRKYVKGYAFLLFARKFGDKYGKKLMDTETKTGMDAAKTASKRVVQKTAEATGGLIGNKITDKIILICKPKEKEKTNEIEKIYILREKRQQIIDDLRLFSWVYCGDKNYYCY